MSQYHLCYLGTRIIYERKFLLDLKSSPLSQTPTKLPVIPGVTLDDNGKIIEEDEDSLTLGTTPEEETEKPAKNKDKKDSNGIYNFISIKKSLFGGYSFVASYKTELILHFNIDELLITLLLLVLF